MSDENNDKVVEELVSILKQGKQLMESIGSELNEKYLVDGKTMNQWRDYFNIKLPQDPDTKAVSVANAKLNNAINEAGFYHAHSCLVEQCIRTGAEGKFDDAFRSLVQAYTTKNSKLPANATLQKMAEMENGIGIKSALATASARTKFWKSIVDMLHEQRRVLEEHTWILHAEAKAVQQGYST